jgi:hypothetical protein
MQFFQTDNDLGQLEWDMAASKIQIGQTLRILGFAVTYFTIFIVMTLCIYFFLENEWRLAGFYSVVSLLGGIPMVVIGQLVALQGTRAILRGIAAQDFIVDRDISENLTVD